MFCPLANDIGAKKNQPEEAVSLPNHRAIQVVCKKHQNSTAENVWLETFAFSPSKITDSFRTKVSLQNYDKESVSDVLESFLL